MQCETNVWGLRPGRAARSARHARRVGGWTAALAMVGGVAHPVRRHGKMRDAGGTPGIRPGEVRTASVPCTRRCLVAGASCCERLGRRASPVWRRRQCKWAANVAMAPMQVGCQCGVVVNVGAPSTQRHPQRSGTPITPLSLIMNPRSRPRRCCID